MYKKQSILIIVPARTGSKGLLKKNTRLLNGNPLITYAIKAAKGSLYADRVVVLTDGEDIAKIARESGAEVPFLEPKELAGDNGHVSDAARYMLRELQRIENYVPDIVILIQPTNPFVLASDIDSAIQTLIKTGTNSCVSITLIRERPERMYSFERDRIIPFLMDAANNIDRQYLPVLYKTNGSVFAVKRDVIEKEGAGFTDKDSSAILMPPERSVDIDTPLDFIIAEELMKRRNL